MKQTEEIKKFIIDKLNALLDDKIATLQNAIKSAKESRDNETKSSVGDKYETSRAMVQIEIEKNEDQLAKTLNLKRELSLINTTKKSDKVEYGTLVVTNHGNYFISIGIGRLFLDSKDYFVISMASPIGSVLRHKTVGDKIIFKSKEIVIQEII